MARVFNDWWLGLSPEERCAHDAEEAAREDAIREEWEAEQAALAAAEPELPFPPRPRPCPAVDDPCPF